MKKLLALIFALSFVVILYSSASFAQQATATISNCSGLSGSAGVAKGCTGGTSGQAASSNLSSVYILCQGTSVVAHTGDTTETALATCTVPANAMGTTGHLRVTLLFENNNDANNKSVRVRFSGLTGTIFSAVANTTLTGARFQTEIVNSGATNSQIGGPGGGFTGFGATSQTVVTAAVDTTSSQTVSITGQLANAADNVQLDYYTVELITTAGN